jgi:hypothetical protein
MRRGPRSRWMVLGLSCAALAFGAPAAASATPGWLSPSKISEFSEDQKATVAVAMDARGDTAIAWVQSNGEKSVIETAWRPAGGTFGTPAVLSSPNSTSFDPIIAMDPQGDITVAWLSFWMSPYITEGNVQATWSSPGGTFAPPVTLTKYQEALNPVIAMDPQGEAIVAWRSYNGYFRQIEEASRPPNGTFGETVALSPLAIAKAEKTEYFSAELPAIAMGPQGNVAIAWQIFQVGYEHGEEVEPPRIQVVTRAAGGSFAAPVTLSGDNGVRPSIAMNSDGATTAAWEDGELIETSTKPAIDGSFETPIALSGGELQAQPVVAMDASGDTAVAWSAGELVLIATRSAGGSFSTPVELGLGKTLSPPVLTMDAQGDGVVAWVNSEDLAEGSTQPAGGAFDAPTRLATTPIYVSATEPSHSISVAMDSKGDVASAWIGTEGTKQFVEVAGYQSGGPSLEALQAPTEGQIGAPLAFSVSPLSVWSTVTSTTWSWGDGSPDTSGTTVTHVFAAPGTYQVSASATDALGNVTNATRTVTIQAPPTLGPDATKPTPISPKSRPKAQEAVVSAFTPLFATRASTGGDSLGLLVGVPTVKGVRAGDTIVIRCTAGCRRPLYETVRIRRHHHTQDTIAISPPLVVRRTTRIEIELLAPGRLARFVQYQFVRTPRGLIAYKTQTGCLSPAGRPRSCP